MVTTHPNDSFASCSEVFEVKKVIRKSGSEILLFDVREFYLETDDIVHTVFRLKLVFLLPFVLYMSGMHKQNCSHIQMRWTAGTLCAKTSLHYECEKHVNDT